MDQPCGRYSRHSPYASWQAAAMASGIERSGSGGRANGLELGAVGMAFGAWSGVAAVDEGRGLDWSSVMESVPDLGYRLCGGGYSGLAEDKAVLLGGVVVTGSRDGETASAAGWTFMLRQLSASGPGSGRSRAVDKVGWVEPVRRGEALGAGVWRR
jgi:hypothetical protein